jgi:hypothetical protein
VKRRLAIRNPFPRRPPAPPPEPATDGPDIDTLRLIHKEIKDRAARLDASSARLDTKAATLLGFVSAAAIFLATQTVSGEWKAAAYLAWAGTVVCGLAAMGVRRWKDAPEPTVLLDLVATRPEAVALTLLAAAQSRAFTANRAVHERKAQYWRLSVVFLILAVLTTAAAITFGGTDARQHTRQPKPEQSVRPSAGVGPSPSAVR